MSRHAIPALAALAAALAAPLPAAAENARDALEARGFTFPSYDDLLARYLSGREDLLEFDGFVLEYGRYALCEESQRIAALEPLARRDAMRVFETEAEAALRAAIDTVPPPMKVGFVLFHDGARPLGEYDPQTQEFPIEVIDTGALPTMAAAWPADLPEACVPRDPRLPRTLSLRFRGADLIDGIRVPPEEAEAFRARAGDAPLGVLAGGIMAPVWNADGVAQLVEGAAAIDDPGAAMARRRRIIGAAEAAVTEVGFHRLNGVEWRGETYRTDIGALVHRFDEDWFTGWYQEIYALAERTAQARAAFAADAPPLVASAAEAPVGGPYRVIDAAAGLGLRVSDGAVFLSDAARRAIEGGARGGVPRDRIELSDRSLRRELSDLPAIFARTGGFDAWTHEAMPVFSVREAEQPIWCGLSGGAVRSAGATVPAEYPRATVDFRGGGSAEMAATLEDGGALHALLELRGETAVRACPLREAIDLRRLSRNRLLGEADVMDGAACRDVTVADAAGWDAGVEATLDFPLGGGAQLEGATLRCARGGEGAPNAEAGLIWQVDWVAIRSTPAALSEEGGSAMPPGAALETIWTVPARIAEDRGWSVD